MGPAKKGQKKFLGGGNPPIIFPGENFFFSVGKYGFFFLFNFELLGRGVYNLWENFFQEIGGLGEDMELILTAKIILVSLFPKSFIFNKTPWMAGGPWGHQNKSEGKNKKGEFFFRGEANFNF